ASHYKWLNNLHFENEILQATFNDYYSRVRVQEENLKAMDQKIREIAESEPYRRSWNLEMLSRSDYLTAMFLLSEVMISNDSKQRFFHDFLGLVPENIRVVPKENKQALQKREVPDFEGFW
ncbi:hypothetical protein LEP1GSC076_3199, partial [Leptospira sp. Fiocruz LV4135]